jgi:hypothetical protein
MLLLEMDKRKNFKAVAIATGSLSKASTKRPSIWRDQV